MKQLPNEKAPHIAIEKGECYCLERPPTGIEQFSIMIENMTNDELDNELELAQQKVSLLAACKREISGN